MAQNAHMTKERILKAARSLFTAKGFAGTSLSQIAKLANVTQSLLAHHFGSKQDLFKQVKADIIQGITVLPVNPKPDSFETFLREAIEQRLNIYKQAPELAKLVSWERIEETKTREELAGIPHIRYPRHWLEAIAYLQANKKIKHEYAPSLILSWILYSVNALIYDEVKVFQHKQNVDLYIEMIIRGMVSALTL